MPNIMMTGALKHYRDLYLTGAISYTDLKNQLHGVFVDPDDIQACLFDWDHLKNMLKRQQAPEEETGPTPQERNEAIQDIQQAYLEETISHGEASAKLYPWTNCLAERDRIIGDWFVLRTTTKQSESSRTRLKELTDQVTDLNADNRRTRMLRALETVYGRIRFEADKALNVISPMVCNREQAADSANLKTLWDLTGNRANATLREAAVSILVIVQTYREANEAIHRMETATIFSADLEPASQNIEDTNSTPTHNPLCAICLEPTREGCRNCTWYKPPQPDFEPGSQNIEDRAAKFGRHDPCDDCESETGDECNTCPWTPQPKVNSDFPPIVDGRFIQPKRGD